MNTSNKPLLVLALGILLSGNLLAQTTLNFTSGEGYTTNGSIVGQDGWAAYGFGNGGVDFDINTTNETLVYSYSSDQGAVRRDFSAGETGQAFVADNTIVTWSFTIFDIDNTQPFNTGLYIYLGDDTSGITMQIRGDGLLQVNDGVASGNDRLSADLQNGETVSIEMNYITDTYTLSRSTVVGDVFSLDAVPTSFTNRSFLEGQDAAEAYRFRLQGTGAVPGNGTAPGNGHLQIGSVSVVAVPEPSTYVLMTLGFVGLVAFRRYCKA